MTKRLPGQILKSLLLAALLVGWLPMDARAKAAMPPLLQNESRPPDGGIFKWNGRDWKQVPGAGFRISVAPDGSPWMVQSQGNIYRWLNGSFEQLPGRARDIGVGANGAVWIIGWDNGIYRWTGQSWERVAGSGVTISVQPNGAPWVVNAAGEIYRWMNDHFELQAGRARAIGVEKSIWVIDQDGLVYNWRRGSWVEEAGAGNSSAGNAKRISIAPDGSPWVVNTANEIYHLPSDTSPGRRPPTPVAMRVHALSGDSFQKLPGAATDIGVGADGSVWIIGTPGTSSSGIGGMIGSIAGGSAKQGAGAIGGLPPRSDAGPIPGRSAENLAPQKFRYPPSVIPGTDSVMFKFVTTLSTIPIIEVSKRPPEPGPKFHKAAVVSAVFPVAAGKQTKHNLRVENLKPATRYYYIITIADEAGNLITEEGEFITSVRID